jgi:mycofactocin system transcriptional regulator
VTTHALIEEIAFRLFDEQGFDNTTVEQIADAAGIARRTLFRYYPSKNDIPWGQFDESLRLLAQHLREMPADVSTAVAVQESVKAFNHVDPAAVEQHRRRMRLLMNTPALQAHATLRHGAWRAVIASYVAERHGMCPDDLHPRTIGRVALALALSAYEQWLEDEQTSLPSLLDETFAALHHHLDDQRAVTPERRAVGKGQ